MPSVGTSRTGDIVKATTRCRVLVRRAPIALCAVAALAAAVTQAIGQEAVPVSPIATPADARSHGLEDLKTAVRQAGGVPRPNLGQFVRVGKGRELAALGKMLFWDQSIGSDGQSCASCHYHAGSDRRSGGVVSPALLRVLDQRQGDIRGYGDAGAAPAGNWNTAPPGGSVSIESFPHTKNPGDLNLEGTGIVGPGMGNSDNEVSSPGVTFRRFEATFPQRPKDKCTDLHDAVFSNANGNLRRVPPRNTPSAVNAVFNLFNFWDGRARPEFNGQNPFGDMDPNARVLRQKAGVIEAVRVSLPLSSLASQATGPALSEFEESCGDAANGNARTWPEIGKKLLRTSRTGASLRPLNTQLVDPTDSLIGGYSRGSLPGADTSYEALIKAIFRPAWWGATQRRVLLGKAGTVAVIRGRGHKEPVILFDPNQSTSVAATPEEIVDPSVVTPQVDGVEDPALTRSSSTIHPSPHFTQMEANFALFFGLAVQAYEATLVADSSPFDQWMRSGNFNAKFGADQLAGLNVFVGDGKCIACHKGPELTGASVRNARAGNDVIEPMLMGDTRSALYDNGFYNIGVTPTVWDIGRGSKGPFNTPLASSRQVLFERALGMDVPHPIIGENGVAALSEEGLAVCDDANGNDRCDLGEAFTAEFQRAAVDGAFKTPGLRNVELTGPYFHNGEAATLRQAVEFYDNGGHFCQFNFADLDPDVMPLDLSATEKSNLVKFLVSLTDERSRREKAPFDHPSLKIPSGGAPTGLIRIAANGRSGAAQPLQRFLNENPQELGNFPEAFQCSAP